MVISPHRSIQLKTLAALQRSRGESHFEGITYLNLAEAQRAMGSATEALDSATKID